MTPEQLEYTVLHESGHLAAAVLLHLRPTRAEITPGHPDQSGAVYMRGLAEDIDQDKARRICLMTLCGLAAGGAGEMPNWPLRESESRDEKLIAGITSVLGFDEGQYAELQDETWDLTFSRTFERAFIASETLLRRHWVIGREAIAIVRWAAFSHEDEEAERELELCAA